MLIVCIMVCNLIMLSHHYSTTMYFFFQEPEIYEDPDAAPEPPVGRRK